MTTIFSGLFNNADRVASRSLDFRTTNAKVINANVANAETPGYRAIGYEFEEQLQAIAGLDESLPMKATRPEHRIHAFAQNDGTIEPDIYIRPNESIANDGNTVDLDQEMGEMAKNEILFRSAVEMINRKVALLRYAINNGGRS